MEKEKVQKVRLKLTPLNLVTAAILVAGCYFAFNKQVNLPVRGLHVLYFGLCMLAVFVSFVSDLIFRRSLTSLRKVWIVEGAFIVFTIVLILIIKIVLFN